MKALASTNNNPHNDSTSTNPHMIMKNWLALFVCTLGILTEVYS